MIPSLFQSMTTAAPRASTVFWTKGPGVDFRVVTDHAAVLCVTAFHVRELATALAHFDVETLGTYLISGEWEPGGAPVYVGEGKVRQRLEEHAADSDKAFARTIYVIVRRDRHLSKMAVKHYEACLMTAVEEAGVDRLVNTAAPCFPKLTPECEASFNNMLAGSWHLVYDAGCRSFAKPSTAASLAEDGWDDIQIGVSVPAGAAEYDLTHGKVWARGAADGKRIIVLPGSLLRTEHNPSIGPKRLVDRRDWLLKGGAVIAVPGDDTLMRAVTTISFPTQPIAAKCLTGANVGREKWRRVQSVSPATPNTSLPEGAMHDPKQ